jgi:hypothetical protein
MTKRRSSKVGKCAQSKNAAVARQKKSAATDNLNGESLPRDKASFKVLEEKLSPGRKGGHQTIGSTKRVEPSRRNTAPKLEPTETTGLPRHIADERVIGEMDRAAPSWVVPTAKIRATHGPKTSLAAEPLKRTSRARAEVEHTTSARPFEAVNNDGFEAAAEEVLSFCLKSMGFAARRMSVALQLASNLARARDLSEVVELQAAHWRRQLDEVAAQIEESHSFITKMITGIVMHSATCKDRSSRACSARRS